MGKQKKGRSGSRLEAVKPQEAAVLSVVRRLFDETSDMRITLEAVCKAVPGNIPHLGVRTALLALHRKNLLGVAEGSGIMIVYASREALRQDIASVRDVAHAAARSGGMGSMLQPPSPTVLVEKALPTTEDREESEAGMLDALVADLEKEQAEKQLLEQELTKAQNKQRVAEERERTAKDDAAALRGQLGLVKAELSDTKKLVTELTAEAERVPGLEEEIRQLKARTVVAPDLAERIGNLGL